MFFCCSFLITGFISERHAKKKGTSIFINNRLILFTTNCNHFRSSFLRYWEKISPQHKYNQLIFRWKTPILCLKQAISTSLFSCLLPCNVDNFLKDLFFYLLISFRLLKNTNHSLPIQGFIFLLSIFTAILKIWTR